MKDRRSKATRQGTAYEIKRNGRPTGRWRARTPPDPITGERISLGVFASKEAAESAITAAAVDRARGVFVAKRDGSSKFADVADDWLRSALVRPSTRARDGAYLASMINPHLGARKINTIDARTLRVWVKLLQDQGKAPATVVKAAQVVSKVLGQAVTDRLIAHNPMSTVKLPRIVRAEPRVLTDVELAAVAAQLNNRDRALVLVMGVLGLRPGEAIALRGEDLSVLRRELRVERTGQYVNGTAHIGEPKTPAGRRVVPVPQPLLELLAPLATDPTGLIFGPTLLRMNNWQRRTWRPALERAGIEPIKVHGLRHTAITRWVHDGLDPVTIRRRAGHESVRTVLDIYARPQMGLTPADERINARAASLIEAAVTTQATTQATVLDLGAFKGRRKQA